MTLPTRLQLLLCTFLICSFVFQGHSDQLNKIPDPPDSVVLDATNAHPSSFSMDSNRVIVNRMTPISKEEIIKMSIVAFFFLLILIGLAFTVTKHSDKISEKVVKVFVVTLVLCTALILITAGYDDRQIAPAFGLLGAVIGYVFGKS